MCIFWAYTPKWYHWPYFESQSFYFLLFCVFVFSNVLIVSVYLFCYEKLKKGNHLFSGSLQSRRLYSSLNSFPLFCIIVTSNSPFYFSRNSSLQVYQFLGDKHILYSALWYAQPLLPASLWYFWMQVPEEWMCTLRSLPRSPPICIKCLVFTQGSLRLPVD